MNTIVRLTALGYLLPSLCLAGIFGEGYSSKEPGGPSDIRFRAFTIYTRQEACDNSAVPVALRILPNPLVLKIGDRIHRSNVSFHQSELIVEAYGENGEFLPAVPIFVGTSDTQGVIASWSDWDYFEAIRVGEDELGVAWACAGPGGGSVEAHVPIVVIANDSSIDRHP